MCFHCFVDCFKGFKKKFEPYIYGDISLNRPLHIPIIDNINVTFFGP
jgi:hypothetical protein